MVWSILSRSKSRRLCPLIKRFLLKTGLVERYSKNIISWKKSFKKAGFVLSLFLPHSIYPLPYYLSSVRLHFLLPSTSKISFVQTENINAISYWIQYSFLLFSDRQILLQNLFLNYWGNCLSSRRTSQSMTDTSGSLAFWMQILMTWFMKQAQL